MPKGYIWVLDSIFNKQHVILRSIKYLFSTVNIFLMTKGYIWALDSILYKQQVDLTKYKIFILYR